MSRLISGSILRQVSGQMIEVDRVRVERAGRLLLAFGIFPSPVPFFSWPSAAFGNPCAM